MLSMCDCALWNFLVNSGVHVTVSLLSLPPVIVLKGSRMLLRLGVQSRKVLYSPIHDQRSLIV